MSYKSVCVCVCAHMCFQTEGRGDALLFSHMGEFLCSRLLRSRQKMIKIIMMPGLISQLLMEPRGINYFSSWAGKENSPSMKHYSTVEHIDGCTKLFMASAIFFWERQNTWKHSPDLLLQFSKEIFSFAWKNSQSWICMHMQALGKPGEWNAFPRELACSIFWRGWP